MNELSDFYHPWPGQAVEPSLPRETRGDDPRGQLVGVVRLTALGPSSALRRVVSHRLQSADTGRSPDNGQPSQVDPFRSLPDTSLGF
jgi:hypothetical protein